MITKPPEATCVYAWSMSDQDETGEEYLSHVVAYADDNGEPLGQLIYCDTASIARTTANELGDKHKLEVLEDLL